MKRGELIMKAISLWQPWASAIPDLKRIETRSWPTNYRGPIAIHAAKTKRGINDGAIFPLVQNLKVYGINIHKLPFGCFVATADLVDCILIPEISMGLIHLNGSFARRIVCIRDTEYLFGDYTPGRYAWIFDNIKVLGKPIPAVGRQGLWNNEEVY